MKTNGGRPTSFLASVLVEMSDHIPVTAVLTPCERALSTHRGLRETQRTSPRYGEETNLTAASIRTPVVLSTACRYTD